MSERLRLIDISKIKKLPLTWSPTSLFRLASDPDAPLWERKFYENIPRTEADLQLAYSISFYSAAMLDAVQTATQANGIPWGEAEDCVGALCRRICKSRPRGKELDLEVSVLSPLVKSLLRKQQFIREFFPAKSGRSDVASYLGDSVVDCGSRELFRGLESLGLKTNRTV